MKLRELEGTKLSLSVELAGPRPLPKLPLDVVESRLNEWRRMLRQSTTQGRAVLQRVLSGRIVFTRRADGRGYDFSAPTRFDRIFAGVATPRPDWVDPTSTAAKEGIRLEDTYDADYGRLLESVRKLLASLASPSWNQIASFIESMRQLRDNAGFAA
jgi:hypothetical protein